jgi:putative tryptophan/tyrosine transport system substrate-binding protein
MRRREFIALIGGAAAWPYGARAQQQALPVIGFLSGGAEEGLRTAGATAAFHQGLGESGFIEGRNVEILYRWAETHNDRLPALAADLVRRRVAVIVATASPGAALAAKSATATIPIVFQVGVDPVEFGLVASISRPGGNLTGTSFLIQELVAKRLELLHQIVPTVTTIGFLVNPTMPGIETQIREAEVAARTLGVSLVVLNATTASEIEAAFAVLLRQGIGALMSGSDALLFEHSAQVVTLAARHGTPAIYSYGVIVNAGGLISYGSIPEDAFRLVGVYAGRILKGEKPADLPVQQSTKFKLVINLKTAKALGLDVPASVLARADEVIE